MTKLVIRLKCDHIKNGIQCKGNALRGDSKCFVHSDNPKMVSKRTKGRSMGGYAKNSKRLANIPKIKSIDTFSDIKAILIDSLNELRNSATTSTVAKVRTIGYLCTIFTELVARGDLEQRIVAIEKQLAQQ